MLELGPAKRGEVTRQLGPGACSLRVVQWPFEEWPEDPEEAPAPRSTRSARLACPLAQSYLCLTALGGADPALPPCSLLVNGSPGGWLLEMGRGVCDRRPRSRRLEPAQVA